mmetsp:Transcript_72760/g.188908  ORF Transcript_72760/g.188908 Transcript_72760/m.188908 type:complete len:195 (-) Transcript_72760:294-878(-)
MASNQPLVGPNGRPPTWCERCCSLLCPRRGSGPGEAAADASANGTDGVETVQKELHTMLMRIQNAKATNEADFKAVLAVAEQAAAASAAAAAPSTALPPDVQEVCSLFERVQRAARDVEKDSQALLVLTEQAAKATDAPPTAAAAPRASEMQDDLPSLLQKVKNAATVAESDSRALVVLAERAAAVAAAGPEQK